MADYVISPQARVDLWEIELYVAEHDSFERAEYVQGLLDAGIEKVAQAPWIGHVHREIHDPSLRVWCVHSWLIVYKPDSRPVEIVRVIDGRRDVGAFM